MYGSTSNGDVRAGYLCQVCGKDVECMSESDLYLRYVIGEIDPEVLHTSAERHIRCNPVLAQFIEHAKFEPMVSKDPFPKGHSIAITFSSEPSWFHVATPDCWNLKHKVVRATLRLTHCLKCSKSGNG